MNFSDKEKRSAQAASSYIKIAVILICAVAAVSAMALAVFNRLYIGDNGLYVNSAPAAIPVALAVIAVGAAVFATMHTRSAQRLDALPETGSYALPMLSFVITAEFFAMFIIYLLLGAVDIQYGFGGSIEASPELAEKMKTALFCYKLMMPFSLFAPIYFIVVAFKKRISALFGSVTLIWIMLYILRLYFDVTDWVTSPRKLTMICAMCIAALFILYEIRFTFSRGSSRKYVFFASLSAIFCFACGFAGVFSVLSGVYPLSYELSYFGVCLLIGVYALIRVISFIPKAKRYEDDSYCVYESGEKADETEAEVESSAESESKAQ